MGYEECCQEILKSNPRTVLQRDQTGLLPIHYAVLAGHANLLSMLIDCHRDLGETTGSIYDEKLIDPSGLSLLHFACLNGHSSCVETIFELADDDRRFVNRSLVEMLRWPRPPVFHPFSPAHCACLNSHATCLSLLIDRLASDCSTTTTTFLDVLDAVDSRAGNSPLHLSAMNNDYESASMLIDAGCDVNKRNRRGRTPLMFAAANNSFGVIELLLKKKHHHHHQQQQSAVTPMNATIDIKRADLDQVDDDGNSALHLALANKHENCALYILDEIKEDAYVINAQNNQGK